MRVVPVYERALSLSLVPDSETIPTGAFMHPWFYFAACRLMKVHFLSGFAGLNSNLKLSKRM
jgi:hypothetical protein